MLSIKSSIKSGSDKADRWNYLIDEIDLHLHPEWQIHILQDLQKAFPKLQFIVTTHAPLVISALNDCRIYSISSGEVYDFPLQYGRNADSVLQTMGVQKMKQEYQTELESYLLDIENGNGYTKEAMERRKKLDNWLGKEHSDLQKADLMLSFFGKPE